MNDAQISDAIDKLTNRANEAEAKVVRAAQAIRAIEHDRTTPMNTAADLCQIRGEILGDWT